MIVGTQRRAVPKHVEGAAVSDDGTRMIWWYREDDRRRIVINGTAGPKFTRVSRPILHAESGTFVYTAERDGGFHVVTPLDVSPKYQGVLWNPRISPDGASAGFIAYFDKRLWWKVLPLK